MSQEALCLSDISEFLRSYSETLHKEILGADMPVELKERFTFDSCVKQRPGREVYYITRKEDGRRAVLRVTDPTSGEDAVAESIILAGLNHPAIPKTLGAWGYNGRGYLAREYFVGDDLHTYIRKHGLLSRDMLLDIAIRLCDILSYIHSRRPSVVHRDIKPENIIISGKDCVRLIDFGIARNYKPDADMDTQVTGTRPYMAPEQFGSEQTDNRADIYSLGVVMIYMATGATAKQRLRADYPYKELAGIIEKCIKKDRDGRFKTAARLKQRILWVRRKVTRKILLCAGMCVIIAAAFAAGLYIGQERGYISGLNTGQKQGFESGFDVGQEQGFESGLNTGQEEGFESGFAVGQEQGFESGVASIMDVPAEVNRPFTQEELDEPITFDNWYIDMAVRNALNKDQGDKIYRREVSARIGEIRIFGTYILHPSLDIELIKTHISKGAVSYMTSDGFWIDSRGDISSLADIPNAYYLRTLTLTSQTISDLSPLEGMKLENINLSDNYIGNLLPLKDMVTLRELDVCQNPLRDLTPISRLLSLEYLDISHTQATDLAPLAELTKLETLKLNYCDVSDISVLKGLTNLREVDLSNTLVTDLTPLSRQGKPIKVRCAGLSYETVEKARGIAGITIVEE